MNVIGYGIDVSYHQTTAFLNWKSLLGQVDVVMVRAAYGGNFRDPLCATHVKNARAIAADVGLYQFFVPSQSVDVHFDTLLAMVEIAGLGAGDIVPALDIEDAPIPKPGAKVDPSWSEPCEELVGRIVDRFGDCLVYITQRDWGRLGKPAWVLERPIWVAHYPGLPAPATPGNVEAFMHQHRVGPFARMGAGGTYLLDGSKCPLGQQPEGIDQNRLLKPLPRIRYESVPPESSIDSARIHEMNAMSLAAQAYAAVDVALNTRRSNIVTDDESERLA